ncbi:hypothetical protein [Rhodococcus sp. JVH1]|uniref:hypothetical protein n=1 Tax=Rhodococcus sp. JVH1 TaxID=745408 RepID=UPI00027207F5|nr:hypothetical protein [Rhodococcus sp. JVH1]EJJ01026.1 hypothetical protein JVH1_1652 [Rhodococcus sp. JVH1]
MADPIDSVVSLTRQVMCRLLGLDTTPAEPAEVHIHVHIHGDDEQPDAVKAQWPRRYRGKR